MRDLVRPATSSDTAALHRLAAVTFPLACTPETPEEEKSAFIAAHLSEAAFARFLSDPTHTLLVAADPGAGELVGYTMLVAGEPDDVDVTEVLRFRPTAELSKMYVHPDRHGSGTADRLMAAVLAAARDSGAAGVWLGVSEQNARANAFYARHGFEQVGRKRFHIGPRWEDDFVREHRL